MKVLLDTCIVIDLLQKREPFFENAKRIFLCIANRQFEGFISAKSLTDIHYLMHRYTHSEAEARKVLGIIMELACVLSTDGADCRNALVSPVTDYEDAVMIETAVREHMDCIVTRNLGDYIKSPVPIYSPEEFFKYLTQTSHTNNVC